MVSFWLGGAPQMGYADASVFDVDALQEEAARIVHSICTRSGDKPKAARFRAKCVPGPLPLRSGFAPRASAARALRRHAASYRLKSSGW